MSGGSLEPVTARNAGRILFVRHAESTSNAGGVSRPHREIPLTENGLRQADCLAQILPCAPAQVLVSPMIRTHQTAAPYCARVGMAAQVRDDLTEFSMADYRLIAGFDGAQRSAFVRPYWERADPDHRLGDGAETFREFAARVDRFIEDMDAVPEGSVVFGHGLWLSMLIWKLGGAPAIDSRSMRMFRHNQLALQLENCVQVAMDRTTDAWHWRIVRWSRRSD